MAQEGLQPRLCHIQKGDQGYGFHLHGEKNKVGQYIRKVEAGSPAEVAGLRAGDRVLEVNGENVEKETHHQVVQRIKAIENETRLLVVDRKADEYRRLSQSSSPPESQPNSSAPSSPSVGNNNGEVWKSKEDTSQEDQLQNNHSTENGKQIGPPKFQDPDNPQLKKPAATDGDTNSGLMSGVSGNSLMLDPAPLMASSPSGKGKRGLHFGCCGSSPFNTRDTGELELNILGCPAGELTIKEDINGQVKDKCPRLCQLKKGPNGYGFNLHSEKSRPGQFIRSVDPGSPAAKAGLRPQDRLVEVNKQNVENMKHSEVVAIIKSKEGETTLLVVDPETDEYLKKTGVSPSETNIKEGSVPQSLTNGMTKTQVNGGSSTSSSHSDLQSPDKDSQGGDVSGSDPFEESGLRLSPTAAEAKEKARAKRSNKRAPQMDWSKKHEIFSNF